MSWEEVRSDRRLLDAVRADRLETHDADRPNSASTIPVTGDDGDGGGLLHDT